MAERDPFPETIEIVVRKLDVALELLWRVRRADGKDGTP